jgi:hypothetical protein
MTPSSRLRKVSAPGAVAFAAIVLAGASLARGADEEATARALFSEGRRLAAAGDYAAACPKFEDSYRLDPGIGTNFNLADCFEHIGRTASAWARFLDVAAATRAAGQGEREKVARARAEALEPRLARLIIVVSQPVDGLAIRRDGTSVGEASWGVAVPIDPGTHLVEASAPHKLAWSLSAEVPQTPGDVRVEVPVLADAPPNPPPAAPASVVAATGVQPSAVEVGPPRRARTPVVIALGAVGLAGLTVGTIYGIKFLLANDQLSTICIHTPNACPQSDYQHFNQLRADAYQYRTYEFVGFGVGTAALLAAAYLWWRWPVPRASARGVTSTRPLAWPSLSDAAWGLTLSMPL